MKGGSHENGHYNRSDFHHRIGGGVEGLRALPVLFLKNIVESPSVVLKKATAGLSAVAYFIGTSLYPILLGGWTNPR